VLSLHEMFGSGGKFQEDWMILDENEIADGIDELGVLLYGHKNNAYWYGSQLSIEETREIAPYQNATGLQVTSAVLAGMVWAIENPDRRHRRSRRDGLQALPRSAVALSRARDRHLYGMDTARQSRRAVRGGCRHIRPLAVQEYPGALKTFAPAKSGGELFLID
jgi:hypothetical protein